MLNRMAIYCIRLDLKDRSKTCYVRLPELLEAQDLALHTAAQLSGVVRDVMEVQEKEFLTEIQQARFIYIE